VKSDEEYVRRLMRQAGASIIVKQDRHAIDEPVARRRSSPLFAAAAAVAVVVVVVSAVGLGSLFDGERDSPVATTRSSASPHDGGSTLDDAPRSLDVTQTPTESSTMLAPKPPTEPSAGRADAQADAFVAFSRGAGSEVLWSGRVSVSLGGSEVTVLSAGEAAEPGSWNVCPPRGEYEMRECPLSPLKTLQIAASEGTKLLYEGRVPEVVGCSAFKGRRPADDTAYVAIRPEATRRDCFSDFAISLYFNPSGAVTAVDLTLSGP
jgi:hypothetical protein